MKDLQDQMKDIAVANQTMELKIKTQSNVIEKLRRDMDDKDKVIADLKYENELLIVKNERLECSANKTMRNEIDELKDQLRKNKEQLKVAKTENSDLQKTVRDQMRASTEGGGTGKHKVKHKGGT